LNFVNNFAGLSVELLDELKDAADEAIAALDGDKRAEIDETIAMLTGKSRQDRRARKALGEVKQRRPELPVMMVTAYGDEERRRRASALGAAEYIAKPVDFDHLKEQLQQLPGAPRIKRAAS
jgi:DNA-binding NtrC family response regulator